MEEGNVMRLSSLRPSGTLKSSLSGKSSPRSSSPSYRRLNSGRTPRREGSRNSAVGYNQWCRSNRIVLWLLLITLWAYAGFYVQSKWAHEDKDDRPFGYGNKPDEENPDFESNISSSNNNRRGLISNEKTLLLPKIKVQKNESNVVSSPKKGSSGDRASSKKRRKRSRGKKVQNKVKRTVTVDENDDEEVMGDEIMKRNTTYGLLVGPFRSIEDRILEWSPEKRSGTCDRRSGFSRIVWSRKFVLVFHELSMTGAPLAMMELATEFLSCGATVTVVVLSRKGGLMGELKRRKINVLEDKDKVSFKIASKADLIIAGSAVCSSWIEQYFEHTLPGSSSQVAWWIMENRREYFDRSKPVLDQVKKLIFLSESQTKQWLTWCKEDNITLKSDPTIIPLSVNDELAFVAGISSSLNTPSFNKEKMTEKRQVLRRTVRTEMGLSDQDMLAVCLSSINPGKGQIYVLESARLLMENGNGESSKTGESVKILFGSVGSKSNKVAYVKALLGFLSLHSNLSKSVLWTPATTRIASLYAAADVYVMNSQGLGETFGRVTIEAMAFGLPVLGTDAGGTKEIVEDNVTGFLHPVGRPGAAVLAKNLEFLLKNGSLRQEMGNQGRKKVEEMYLKKNMFKKFGEVLFKCMRIKSR